MKNVSIVGLGKKYDDNVAVAELDLEVRAGEFLSLLGPSGCGKTTTLRCLGGLETPTAGTISVGEETFVDVNRGTFVPPNKRHVGMVFQSYALWPNRNVQGNVSYPLKLRGVKRREITAAVDQVLTAVGMQHLKSRYPHELSGGQQQRVALARGLVSATKLMLFDEPLSNLDAQLRLSMRSEIRRLHDTFEHTSIYVTHDQGEALAMSDRIVVMRDGKIEQVGTPGDIYRRPQTAFVARFMGMENILECLRVSHDNGQPEATLEGGLTVPAEGALADIAPGRHVVFRGSDATLAQQAPSAPGLRFRGRVTESSYTGEGYRVGTRVSEDTTITCFISDTSANPKQEKYVDDVIDMTVPQESLLLI